MIPLLRLLPGQFFDVLALRQRLTHTGYLLGRKVAGGTAEGESADVNNVGVHTGGCAAGRQLLWVLGATVRCGGQVLWMMRQAETGHRRGVAVLSGCVTMNGTDLTVAVAIRR